MPNVDLLHEIVYVILRDPFFISIKTAKIAKISFIYEKEENEGE